METRNEKETYVEPTLTKVEQLVDVTEGALGVSDGFGAGPYTPPA